MSVKQQWRGFAAWSETVEPAPSTRGVTSPIERRPVVPLAADLKPQPRPRIGLVCPRCGGEVVQEHPLSRDALCLQCGFEPITRRPVAYIFEPYEDNAATARASYVPEPDHRHGPITVKVAAEPLSPFVCVKCGRVVGADEPPMKVHRCGDCYRDYVAALRFRVA